MAMAVTADARFFRNKQRKSVRVSTKEREPRNVVEVEVCGKNTEACTVMASRQQQLKTVCAVTNFMMQVSYEQFIYL
jgi:diaminopimelate epimerase